MKPLLALILATATLMPSASFAGDREWATAGKILTGVVGLQFLRGVSDRHHDDYRYRQEVYSQRCDPPPRYIRSCAPNYNTTTTIIRYEPAPVQVIRYEQPPVQVIRYEQPPVQVVRVEPAPAPVAVEPAPQYQQSAPVGDNPIILEVNSTRRIFQPRIHGHTAYLQIFDQGQWFTLREYPSVY